MESIVCRSFDLVAAITNFKGGESVTNDPLVNNVFAVGPGFGFVWMYTKGRDVLINTVTGETIERVPGDSLISNPIPYGEWRSTIPEDFEVICYSPFLNAKSVPLSDRLEPVVMATNSSRVMPHMTQFFLGKGTIEIDGKTFSGPRQVLLKTGDKQVTAVTQVYGFIVK